MDATDWARGRSEQLLASLRTRRLHVWGVAETAERVCERAEVDARVLVSAAWLHDIGYAPDLISTGFHPLDGARYLRALGVDDCVVSLVAHHSCSHIEAKGRGLLEVLMREFPTPDPVYSDALCYCDMTIGPAGESVTVEERIEEILDRYEAGTVVHESIVEASPLLIQAVRRVEDRMAVQSQWT